MKTLNIWWLWGTGSSCLCHPCVTPPGRGGKEQRDIAGSFSVSVSNQYFLLQRLIRLLTLWQEFNNIRHREHSEVNKTNKQKKISQPVRLNHPFAPVRTPSTKQNPNNFSLPSRPSFNPKTHSRKKHRVARAPSTPLRAETSPASPAQLPWENRAGI